MQISEKNKQSRKTRNKGRTKMKIPYLGKVSLFWCRNCNLPLLDDYSCENCNSLKEKVDISPPGDVRPAFWKDYYLLQNTVNSQFGSNVGTILFSENNIVLLNRIGGLDRVDEVIMHGEVVGLFLYNPIFQKYQFHPRLITGKLIYYIQNALNISLRKQIWINNDALPFILSGKSILVPGTLEISPDIKKDDFILIINSQNHNSEVESNIKSDCVAIGVARSDYSELISQIRTGYGNLAKNKTKLNKNIKEKFIEIKKMISISHDIIRKSENLISNKENFMNYIKIKLKNVYEANISFIKKQIEKSVKFILTTIKSINKPIAVAYSGGKDSLCTLLLVWKAIGPKFKVFFANTGLELPEVEDNVQLVTKALGIHENLIIKNANDTFWNILESFGPPGRDYRYCCHSLKAQQITEIINTIYNGEKVLTFLGQRQYESLNRSKSKLIYTNSFIPLQIAATPIKTWNALLLWLFVLFEPIFGNDSKEKINIPINPLYFEGHERLGCYLCPASNLSSFKLIKESHPKRYKKWFDYLNKYSEKFNLPKEWIELGLWRFKKFSPQWKNLIQELNIPINFQSNDFSTPLNLTISKGFSPCIQSGYSIKGRFSQPLNLINISNIISSISNNYDYDEELNVITIQSQFKLQDYRYNLFSDGSFILLVQKKDFDYVKFLKLIVSNVLRSIYCNQCKTCISICPNQAIKLNEASIFIDENLCNQCLTCVTHCPLYQMSKKLIEGLNNL